MSYLTEHWSFDPFLIIAIILVVWHEIGLARLARRSRPERTRQRRLRSIWFYGGLVLLLMFAAPVLIVAGAPWQPLLDGLPWRAGRSVTAGVMRGGWSRPLRVVGGWLLRPWVAVVLFNAVMLFWHVPGPYDLSENNQYVHIWLMHSTFLIAGVLFWLQFI